MTSRKKAEEALKESEHRLKEAQSTAHIGDWQWDIITNKVYWSDELFRIYGYGPHEIQPDYGLVVETMHPESKAEFLAAIDAALKGERSFEMDYTFFRRDGVVAVLHTIGKVFRDANGKPVRMVGIVQDITERKQVEEALRESEKLYRNLIETTVAAAWEVDLVTLRFTYISPQIMNISGFPQEQWTGFNFWAERVHPEDREYAVSFCQAETAKGLDHAFEYRMITADNGIIWIRDVVSVIKKNGKAVSLRGYLFDITERKQAEEALHESEERYRILTETSPNAITVADTSGQITMVNNCALAVYGHSGAAEVLGRNILEWVPPKERKKASDAFARVRGGGNVTDLELRLMKGNGELFWASVNASLAPEHDGRPPFVIIVTTDVTDRKTAEEKIRQSESFIRNILDTVDEGFIVIDRDFRILMANKAYCGQVGESCDPVIGRHCYEISHKALRPCHEEGEECAVLHVFETGKPHTALHKHPDAKGSILYVETKAFPIKDGTGAVTSVIETVNNITEKHLLEEEQLKSQKLEAIGTLAGGIAHDFNNLLQGVFGYISMAKMTLDQKERSLAMLEQAEKALHMSVDLTTQLLTFSKGGKPVKKKIQLKSVVENSVRFALSGSRVDFKLKFDEDLWAVDADEGQIGQVVQNIVLNADQAMPMGGTIEIAAKKVCAPRKGLPGPLAEGMYIEISVKDSGVGIPKKYISRLFDPYFTTKEKGSGLGLATSYSIIKNHGGLIDVKSQLGKGSTFFVYLPAVETAGERDVTVPATTEAGRKGRVLVMDDEELIRNIVGIMLRALGHEAEFAEDGEEAIARYSEALSSGRRFDIVILDLTVRGGMGGEDTLRELFALDPEVKAVVSSGYADSATISQYDSRGFSACLTKPYEVDALGDIINVLLK